MPHRMLIRAAILGELYRGCWVCIAPCRWELFVSLHVIGLILTVVPVEPLAGQWEHVFQEALSTPQLQARAYKMKPCDCKHADSEHVEKTIFAGILCGEMWLNSFRVFVLFFFQKLQAGPTWLGAICFSNTIGQDAGGCRSLFQARMLRFSE